MKLVYIANVRLPTERAHGINIIKTCEAFARAGEEVTLIIPNRRNHIKDNPFSYYGVERIFHITKAFSLDLAPWKFRNYWLNTLSFSFGLLFSRTLGKKKETIIFTRDEIGGLLLSLRGYRIFYDMHGFPLRKRWFWKIAMRAMTGIVATSRWKVEQSTKLLGVQESRMLVAPNGFDERLFAFEVPKKELRKELGLPNKGSIVLYSGHLYDWKGAFVFADTAHLLPSVFFVLVGGTEHEIKEFRERYAANKNVIVVGKVPYVCVPRYLKAADALVLPSSRQSAVERLATFSTYDTSPIKLFEYMASGTPIVASDVPSTRAVVDEKSAVLVEPDNPRGFANGIQKVLTDAALGRKIARNAVIAARRYTWEKRAERIIAFIATPL